MAKKEKIHMLLWEGRKYYRGDDGCAFAYDNLEELLQELFNAGVQCLEPDERKEFATAMMNGKIKKTTVIKNQNSNVESLYCEHANDGEIVIYDVVNKNTTTKPYNVFDRKNGKQHFCYGMYCRLEPAQELTDEEKNLCLKYMSQKESLAEADRVFNLFAALCAIGGTSDGRTWHCYDSSWLNENYRNEEREIWDLP